MKIIANFIFFLLLALGSMGLAKAPSASASPQTRNICILLDKNTATALLEVKGAYEITDAKNGSRISSSFSGKRQHLTTFRDGIRWGEGFPGIHQICITPKKNGILFFNGIQYDGSLKIYKIGNKLSIVNELPVESYLRCRLSQEFTYPLENEVMAAIAIAARTTAYHQMETNKEAFWHLDAKEIDYQGSAIIVEKSAICSAIDATKNVILLYQEDGKKIPFLALWTEHSAGKTVAPSNIFRREISGPKEGVEAPHAALARDKAKWVYSISKERLARLLQVEHISSLDLFLDQDSKRAYAVRIKDRKGKMHDMDFVNFQKNIGKASLLSNDLTAKLKGNEVIFHGYGKGLGVGICLYTASAMAQNGEMADKILTTFFPKAELTLLDKDQ